jgi:hypothetical protein
MEYPVNLLCSATATGVALADQGGKSSPLVSRPAKTDNLLEAHPAVPENLHDCR